MSGKSSVSGTSKDYDVVIVGGGSAGCVLAARLSERSALRVLLLEAGPDTPPGREPADIHDPFYVAAYNRANMWPDLNVTWTRSPTGKTRGMWFEQARVLGGGSSVNSMIALRGHPGDFAKWEKIAGGEWSWAKVAPYYRKLERDLDFPGGDHGSDGPIPIRRHKKSDWPPFCQGVEAALLRRSYQFVPDANASPRDGYCAVPMNNLPDRRVSAAMGYLTPEVRARPNLALATDTTVSRILFDGSRVRGAEAVGPAGPVRFGAREVIVSCGALHSPALLLRQGIGPADAARACGIPVVADRPGVGANLQDHPVATVAAFLRPGYMQPKAMRAHGNLSLRFSSELPDCDPQDLYIAVSNKTSWHRLGERLAYMAVVLQQPLSRGHVRLRPENPQGEPDVLFNLLSDPHDLIRLRQGVKLARSLLDEPEVAATMYAAFLASFSERVQNLNRLTRFNAFRSWLATAILDAAGGLRPMMIDQFVAPNARLALTQDDARLDEWLKNNATSFYHVAGTCRMGRRDDRDAVVDAAGRVHGVEGLRVVDNSVMPVLVKSQSNLTAMMIAEKMADAIKADHG